MYFCNGRATGILKWILCDVCAFSLFSLCAPKPTRPVTTPMPPFLPLSSCARSIISKSTKITGRWSLVRPYIPIDVFSSGRFLTWGQMRPPVSPGFNTLFWASMIPSMSCERVSEIKSFNSILVLLVEFLSNAFKPGRFCP